MNLQQLNWKMHLSNPGDTHSETWFKVFNSWIPDAPEIFIDVADYSHVGDGPVYLLSGHHANVILDKTHGRLGLVYDRRQPMEGSNADKLRATLRDLVQGAVRLEDDATFHTKPVFEGGDLKLVINNRGIAANTEANFAALQAEVAPLLDAVLGAGAYLITHDADPKQRLNLNVKPKAAVSAKDILAKLG